MTQPAPQRSEAESVTLSRTITRTLVRRIVDREYEPGTRLPTERELAAEFGVARHVVREALKRMEALGMVRIRQGSGILVEDLQITGGIELFHSMLTRADGSIDLQFLKDVLDFRQEMLRNIVRLVARQRTPDELEQMRVLVHRRRRAIGVRDETDAINRELFRLVARATHNRVYELVFNTIGQMYMRLRPAIEIPQSDSVRYQELLEHLLEAVDQGDEELAGLLMARYETALDATLDQVMAKLAGEAAKG